jgi:hypothetical protein
VCAWIYNVRAAQDFAQQAVLRWNSVSGPGTVPLKLWVYLECELQPKIFPVNILMILALAGKTLKQVQGDIKKRKWKGNLKHD